MTKEHTWVAQVVLEQIWNENQTLNPKILRLKCVQGLDFSLGFLCYFLAVLFLLCKHTIAIPLSAPFSVVKWGAHTTPRRQVLVRIKTRFWTYHKCVRKPSIFIELQYQAAFHDDPPHTSLVRLEKRMNFRIEFQLALPKRVTFFVKFDKGIWGDVPISM